MRVPCSRFLGSAIGCSAVGWDCRGLVTQSCSGRRWQALPRASPALTRVTPRLQARGALGGSPRKALSP